jgi:uncharacterized membrane protein YagU involved in acid resistance
MNTQIAASIGGFVATAPMTAVMTVIHGMLPPHQQDSAPPRQITENAAAQTGADKTLDEPGMQTATLVAHFGYGAVAGIAYAPVAGKTGMHPVLEGAMYGLTVWGASYLGLLPATGLYKSAKEEWGGRNAMMIAAHVVWGGVLGAVTHALSNGHRVVR